MLDYSLSYLLVLFEESLKVLRYLTCYFEMQILIVQNTLLVVALEIIPLVELMPMQVISGISGGWPIYLYKRFGWD